MTARTAPAGSTDTEPRSAGLSPRLVRTMAVTAGASIANNYYAQPLMPTIKSDLGLSTGVAGFALTCAQLGYAAGLLLLLPLGDLVDRRRLVVVVSLSASGALCLFAAAASAALLLAGALLVGTFSVVAQLVIVTAAALAEEDQRGRALGTIVSSIAIGILLARAAAGCLTDITSWRVTYCGAAVLMIVQAGVLGRMLPRSVPDVRLSYGALLRTIPALLREEPVLRLRVGYGAALFASFNVLWTALSFLLADDYGYSTGVIGLFGLVGAAGAFAASAGGWLVDRGRTTVVTGVAAALLFAGWGPVWVGAHHLVALVIGLVAIAFASQLMSITNMTEIYKLRPESRSRLNSAYLICYFMAGALGSALSALLWSRYRWTGVCIGGAAFASVDVLLCSAALVGSRRRRTSSVRDAAATAGPRV